MIKLSISNRLPRRLAAAFALVAVMQCMVSCFKDEPLNAECDIIEAWVVTDNPTALFFNASDAVVHVQADQKQIVFDVRASANLSALAPEFEITPGATITPASGSVHDFTDGPVSYTVRSEDGKWTRTYQVSFKLMYRHTSEVVKYDFDHYYLSDNDKYYCWTDIGADGKELFNWATANPGFMLARCSATPDEYPTTPVDGFNGKAVKLETRSTGEFGKLMKRPLAAGNIFIGTFDLSKALTETLKSTRFGLPFAMQPLKFSGYYKFTPGAVYTDAAGKPVADKTDASTIYSVFYVNHDAEGNPIVLYGDDVQSSPYVVALARLDIRRAVPDWTYFEIEYTYFADVDYHLLDNNGYSLTVVGSSSIDGDLYQGAVGSTLCIDELSIECKKIEE